jgi:ribosome-associated toxin RatA of RatAB toxin-antitoxin module
MLRTVALSLTFGICVVLGAGSAAESRRVVQLESIAETLDPAALMPLLKRGVLSLVESRPGGRLKQATVIGLVQASPDRVWDVLTGYGYYTRFMPNLAELEVVARRGDDVVVAYELEVPGSNLEYSLRHHHHASHRRIDIELADDEGDLTRGAWRWELLELADGSQTLLVYTLYSDVRESSWFLRQALKSQPSLEHGLNVATGLVTVRAVQARAEAR